MEKNISEQHSTGIDCRENKKNLLYSKHWQGEKWKVPGQEKSAEAKESPMWQ